MLTLAPQTSTSAFSAFAGRVQESLRSPLEGKQPLADGFEQAVQMYAGAMRRRFSDAAAGNGVWKPLAPKTIQRKKKLTPWPERILYLTGRLYSSMTPGEPGNIFDIQSDRIVYGTSVPYAHYHQAGGGRLPKRPILAKPTQELLQRCTAPIVAGWREVIQTHVASSRMAA